MRGRLSEDREMKPRIAVPIPTTTDMPYNARSWPAYAIAIESAGGEAVEVPLDLPLAQVRAIAASCAGVCLPGSPADVDPRLYAAEVDPATNASDPSREAVDYTLLEDAAAGSKPVLAVCFGLQSLNVWRGGTLVQDLTPLPVNHSAGASVAIAHSALVPRESTLGRLLQAAPATAAEAPPASEDDQFFRLLINTSHHQAVASPGEGLRICARSPEDGVIEAVENDPDYRAPQAAGAHKAEHHNGRPQFVMGVQWHPERSFDISAASRALFARLIAETAQP
jgi:putative glutamine amidotransferase